MKQKSSEEIVEEPPMRLQILLGVGITGICMLGFWLAFFIATNFFGLREGAMSLIAGFRVLVALGFSIVFLPGAIFGEFWYSKWKKRSFRPGNIAILCILLGEGILVMMIVATVFEMLFPGLELVNQAPILGVSGGIGIIAIALTSRIPALRKFVKKAFE